MEVVPLRLCGKKMTMLRKASMHEDGMNFCYNYFEEDAWENAGFNRKKCSVWSNKVGWGVFNRVVTSAYLLQELYTEGPTATNVNGKFVSSRRYIGWINHLFHEQNFFCNLNLWELFEAMHADEWTRQFLKEMNWDILVHTIRGKTECLAIKAVLGGIDALLEDLNVLTEQGWNIGRIYSYSIERLKSRIADFRQQNTEEDRMQLAIMLNMLHSLWELKDIDVEFEKGYPKELYSVLISSYILDMPAVVIQIIAEEYEIDFWELWKSVKDVAKEASDGGEGKGEEIEPVSTKEFLMATEGELILYWEKGGDITFSKDLEAWFCHMRQCYDQCLEGLVPAEQPLIWILDLMEYAIDNYAYIFTIADFFEETVGNLNDARYLALWKVYEGMLHDEEMKKAGSVIFQKKENNEASNGEGANRQLVTSWTFMEYSKKKNKARNTLRQYMALVANKELRKEVFGF